MRKKGSLLILALLVAGAILAAMGEPDRRVDFESVLALWSDALRDSDQLGMRLTRLTDADEMRIGEELAQSVASPAKEDPRAEGYVNDVAQSLLPLVRRRGLRYQFHVVEGPALNAFSLPGGQVFVTTSMLASLQSEAELAAVLGHEISHVDLRHCVERYQYEYRLQKAGVPALGWMVEIAHRLATLGFSQSQELEADAGGESLTIRAGYDPEAAASVFERMRVHFQETKARPASTPAGEVGQATGEALGSYFRTHPLFEERTRQINQMVARNRGELRGRSFYVGKENLKQREARSKRSWPQEFRTF